MITYTQTYDLISVVFECPVGIGMFSENTKEINVKYPNLLLQCQKFDIDIEKAIQLTKQINQIIDVVLNEPNTTYDIDWKTANILDIYYTGNKDIVPKLINTIEIEINNQIEYLNYKKQILLLFMCGNQKDWETQLREVNPDIIITWYSEFVALISSNTSLLGFRDKIQETIYTPINEFFPAISFCREECLD